MRFVASVVAGLVVALLLFTLMDWLIANRGNYKRADDAGKVVDFIRVRQDEALNMKDRRAPEKPPPPKAPPPPPKLAMDRQPKPKPAQMHVAVPEIDIGVGAGGGPFLGSWSPENPGAEGDIIPIVRIEPRYPRQALVDGIEGHVKFRITIAEDGSVSDAQVIEAHPPRIFTREARRAILRWKFKPRVVDGKAVARDAEQVIQFRMEGG